MSKYVRSFRPVTLLICTLLIISLSGCNKKNDMAGVQNWVVVPVFYATNRLYSGIDGSIQYSDEPNNTELLFGVKNIAVPAPSAQPVSQEKLQQMSWQYVHTNEKQVGQVPQIAPDTCAVKDKRFTKSEIIEAFRSYAKSTGINDGVLFVHGCCANFDTSMKRTAKIAAHMGVPILLYDWVSPVGFSQYLQNETRVNQTVDDFCKFLDSLEKLSDPGTITLLGHSMGAQFVDEAMIRRSVRGATLPLKPFQEVILSNPDVDAKSFLKHAREFADNGSAVRIYISENDDPLKASKLAHGNFARLGSPGALLNQLTEVKGLTFVDITEANTGHEIPFSVLAALHRNDRLALEPSFVFQQLKPGYIYLKRATLLSKQTDNDPCLSCSK